MCGIAGLILSKAARESDRPIRMALTHLVHRGPDAGGITAIGNDGALISSTADAWESGAARISAVLAHTRLSIIDLSEAGRQPLGTSDGRYQITYNGEVYNYLELRAELQALGESFRTNTDTEVVLLAYKRWGTAAFARFVGMFAFAIVDTIKQTVVLVRDFFGIKPLYLAQTNAGVAFASELRPLLSMPGVSAKAAPQAVYDYLRFGLTDHTEQTLFADVKQLSPAHYITVDLRTGIAADPIRYWSLPASGECDLSPEAAVQAVQDAFLRSVQLHLRSDVPVGAALSGGIDSSAIVMAMRHIAPSAEIHTFSFVPDNADISEEKWIDVVNEKARTVVHKIRLSPTDLANDLSRLITAQQEPFGSTSIYAQYKVFEAARAAGVKVMLDGQGADELLAGYHYFIAGRLTSLLRRGSAIDAARLVRGVTRSGKVSLAMLVARSLELALPSTSTETFRGIIGRPMVPRWMNWAWFEERGVVRNPLGHPGAPVSLRRQLTHAVDVTLPHLLRYEDRNSMAHSIESRVPFLTPELAALVASFPEHYLVDEVGTTKSVFRRAMRGIVPDVILDRRDKIGFATPQSRWVDQKDVWNPLIQRLGAGARIPPILPAYVNRLGSTSVPWTVHNLAGWTETFDVTYS